MQVVTCFQCAQKTKIAPNAHRCHICGEDLQHLLLPETVVDFFQGRAHELSERSELGAALAEAERGLTYVDNSELHLLAAILAKQLGRHDRMRQHVAAIPLGDSLRSEAEWLLRSHQDRERALHEAARQAQTPVPRPRSVPPTPASTFLEELLGAQSPATNSSQPNANQTNANQRTYGQMVASVAIVVVAITMVAASWWWIGPGGLSNHRVTDDPASAGESEAPAVEPTLLPTPLSDAPPTATMAAEAPAAMPTLTLLPTATYTPALPDNLVLVAVETPELADANPRHALLIESTLFDIKQYLIDQGYPELAELPIDARVQGDILYLQGIVHLDVQRRQLLEITSQLSGITEVEDVDLLLRPLPTYVVQEGDTLWSIVYNIYGDVERLDEFAAYNRSVLPAPDALAQGVVLQVLPVQ